MSVKVALFLFEVLLRYLLQKGKFPLGADVLERHGLSGAIEVDPKANWKTWQNLLWEDFARHRSAFRTDSTAPDKDDSYGGSL